MYKRQEIYTSKKMPPDGTENIGENCISVIEIIRAMNFTLFSKMPGNIISNGKIAYNIRILFLHRSC